MEEQKETKHDKFLRLATSRTQNVLTALTRLKNCANTATYEYKPVETERIFNAIDEAVAELKAAYAEKPKGKPKVFTLLDVADGITFDEVTTAAPAGMDEA